MWTNIVISFNEEVKDVFGFSYTISTFNKDGSLRDYWCRLTVTYNQKSHHNFHEQNFTLLIIWYT